MLLRGQMTEFYMHQHLPFLPVAPYSTGFSFPIVGYSHKPHPFVNHLEEWKIVRRLGLSHCSQPSRLCCNMSPRCVRAMGVCWTLALFGDAKQALGEGKSGLVETRLTGPGTMTLYYIPDFDCCRPNFIFHSKLVSEHVLSWASMNNVILTKLAYSTEHWHRSAWESLKNSCSSTITISSECNTRWFMLFFYVWIVAIASAIIVLAWLTVTLTRKKEEEEETQKIDDLPVLATHRSGASALLSSKIDGPVAHGSTR